MKLKELRGKWECDGILNDNIKYKATLEVPRIDPCSDKPELYVLFTKKQGVPFNGQNGSTGQTMEDFHRVMHYFKIGDDWSASVDVDWTQDINRCLEAINVAMAEFVPA